MVGALAAFYMSTPGGKALQSPPGWSGSLPAGQWMHLPLGPA